MAIRLHGLPPLEDWNVEEVCDWLEVLGLEAYANQFTEERISGKALAQFDEASLKKQLQMPIGDAKILAREVAAQAAVSKRKRLPRIPLIQAKGQLGQGEPLSPRTREKVRMYKGDGKLREEPLTEEELDCWDDQAQWLKCAITGRTWLKHQSYIGMALYHQPRFCTPQELQRRQLEEKHAARKKQAAAKSPISQAVPELKIHEEDLDGDGNAWEVVGPTAEATSSNDDDQGIVGRNNRGAVGVGDDYDRAFDVYPDVEPPVQMHLQPISFGAEAKLGFIEVMVGPVFDLQAFNRGASGEGGTLGLQDRGIVCLDRQYNAVNFQFYVQRHPNSFARKLCTSRLSFYIEEGHGQRVFPNNILSQLSLLFYRKNDQLNKGGRVDQQAVAECIMKAIPKLLMQTVLEVIQGTGYKQYCEHAVRLYLILHHTAIKLLSFFPQAHQLVYDKVKEWAQNPFSPTASWSPEEVMLAASLVSVPFALLREAIVRRVLHDMQGAANANMAVLLKQNREFLERLTFVQSFFEAGPGRLKLQDLERKYTRCAGTLPKTEREALIKAVLEASVDSCEDWWRLSGMDNIFADDETCRTHLLDLRNYVLDNVSEWRLAVVKPKARPNLSTTHLGAEELGSRQLTAFVSAKNLKTDRRKKEAADLEEGRRLHEGYPTLVNGKLDPHVCLYCQKKFPSTGKLFRHLNKMIPTERMIRKWHASHFQVDLKREAQKIARLECPASCCAGRVFADKDELMAHMSMMGVPGLSPAESSTSKSTGGHGSSSSAASPETITSAEVSDVVSVEAPTGAEEVAVEAGVVDPFAKIGSCFKCSSKRNILFAPCGHMVACDQCSTKLEICPVCSEQITQKITTCWS
jgi:hypothetical protein